MRAQPAGTRQVKPPALERFWTLRLKITLLVFTSVLLALAAGGGVLLAGFKTVVERDLGRRAISIGRTVAQMSAIQTALGTPDGAADIQALAERIRLANNVDYVVVLDMNRVRYSHPLASRIGTVFDSGDEGPALTEQTYFSRAHGVAGPSVRAFIPIMAADGIQQVGVVVVGVLTPGLGAIWDEVSSSFMLGAGLAASVGLLLAVWLASAIKRQLSGLEPRQIARLFEERNAILDAVSEGLIAIDAAERITVINPEARRLLGLTEQVTGRTIRSVHPHSRLPDTLQHGVSERNRQSLLGNTVIVTNRVPIYVGGRIVGAVATFRDRSEVSRLAEELTGVTSFVDSLRAQNHEFMNTLHTIAGLIHLGEHEQAAEHIFSTTSATQETTRFLTRNIAEFRVAALLMGKKVRAQELGLQLEIDRSSRLMRLPERLDAAALVLIMGNLLDNAMEAVLTAPPGRRHIQCLVRDEGDTLTIRVADCGPGIAPEVLPRLYDLNVSTKGHRDSGIGLALVRLHVDHAGGAISLRTGAEGTVFEIRLPSSTEAGMRADLPAEREAGRHE